MKLQTVARRPSLLAGLLVALFIALPFSESHAQGGPPSPEQRAERMKAQLDEIVTALGVTGDIETQVRGILENGQKERTALMESYMAGGDRNPENMQKMRGEMEEIEKGTREELVPILSAEQLATYDTKMKEIAERRGQFGGGRRGPGGSR
jgi:hypothetical protein